MAYSARELAVRALHAAETNDAYANIAVGGIMEKYRPEGPERALLTELCYGTLRRLNTIDWILNKYVKKPLGEQNAWVRNILRTAVYQILYLERIPEAAACNEAVNLGKKYSPRQAGFINAVLRHVVREKGNTHFPELNDDPVEHIALTYSHPPWLVELWLKELGIEKTIRACKADNLPPAVTIRTNLLHTSREALLESLQNEEGLTVTPTSYAPEGISVQGFKSISSLESFRKGLFFVQDESSMLAAHALSPSPGALVLDACGAPGGKATHIAELMGDTGRIITADTHAHRLALVTDNYRRLRINSIDTLLCDARELQERFKGTADFVLVDAPCSGLGVLRRKPDIRWRKVPDDIPRIAALQKDILQCAAACVRPQGVLVYSTCTISDRENLSQITDFSAQNPDFILEDLRPFLSAELDTDGTLSEGYVQIMPYQWMDGFFIARLRRKGFQRFFANNYH
ncbi:MAG: 16S rRNA (cytosine(967)-C(5))-methyltransferase RsmB [Bacillota bacterium]